MAEAKDRAMWFGVDDGTRRYDGVKWTAYTEKEGLYGAPVNALCAMRDGSVYASTNMGISRFRDGKWTRVFPPTGDLPWPTFKLMEARDGSVWAGTSWGALRLSQEGATFYTTKDMGDALRVLAPSVRPSIVPDEAAPPRPYGEGIGVSITGGNVVMIQDFVPLVVCAVAAGGPGEAAGLKVGDRILALEGQATFQQNLLNGPVGTSVRLTVQREGLKGPFDVTVTRRQVEGTIRDFQIMSVFEDREGKIWLGTWLGGGGGVVRFDPAGDSSSAWRFYPGSGWGRVAQTPDGTIWSLGRGVNRFDGKTWTNISLSKLGGDDRTLSLLATRDGTLWVGAFGLNAFRDGAWKFYPRTEAPMPNNKINDLLEASDGALWIIGHRQEVVRFDYGTARWTTYEDLNFQGETPDGAQWFVSQDKGVVRYYGKAWTRYGVEDGLMDAPMELIATRKGVLWATGSHDSTAATAQFDGARWSLQTHPRLSGNTGGMEALDGSLWFRSGFPDPRQGQVGGVLRFDGQAWTHFTPPDAPGFSYCVGQTADGILWVGGTRGLRRFDGHTWARITEPQELAVSVSDVVYETPKGGLWIGTRVYGVFH